MSENSIISYVEKLAEASFGKVYLSDLEYVYGYAKLILMDQGVLDSLFPGEAERKEIEQIRDLFSKEKLDPSLIKNAVPLLRDEKEIKKQSKDKSIWSSEESSASKALEKLLQSDIPFLDIMREGHSIDDVFSLLKQKDDKQTPSQVKEEDKPSNTSKSEKTEAAEKDKKSMPVGKERFSALVKQTNNLSQCLRCKIFGQDEAIRLFADGYFQSQIFRSENYEQKGPSATFLFAGPPGVGKTYLASSVAEILGMPFLRLDMSEFSQQDSVQRLSGVPKTYAAPKPGVLTEFVKNNPSSIVLLDEIEKADIDVIYQFLQILDGGILTDEFTNKSISFKDVLLIFTTNVGKKLYEDNSNNNLSSLPRSVVMKEISNEVNERGNPVFPSAICSRLASGNVIMFNRLGVHNFIDIINKKFNEDVVMFKNLYGYDISIDKRIAPMLLFSQSTNMDARNMSSQSSILLKNEFHEFGRQALGKTDSLLSIDKITLNVDLDNESAAVKKLFINSEESAVLYIGEPDKISGIPLNPKIKIEYSDKNTVLDDIVQKDISFVLIDLKYDMSANDKGYLSLDDVKNEAVVTFDKISNKFPNMPIYFVHKDEIRREDIDTFLELGARGFIKWSTDAELSDMIIQISDMVYMQARVDELSGRGRVLTYNTAQQIKGNVASISFYDFKIEVAADADEDKMILSDSERPTDRFDDVIGAENAKSELMYFVDYLKNPKKYMAKSVKPPRGILLYGPPGTGKTMLARAMAGESDVTFIPSTSTAFLNRFVGEGEKQIRQLFSVAKRFAPSIIFIDEIDAIGKTRTGSTSTHHTETLLNALLTEMDGFVFDQAKPVFVVAATNYGLDSSTGIGDGIDPALLRRFDNRIYVDLPNEEEREKYLAMLFSKVEVNTVTPNAIHNIAQRTTGQSLAILKNIVELALRNANKISREIDDDVFLNAYEEYSYGEKNEWNEGYYASVAIHESGHAYVSFVSGEKPSFVTIVSRGDFGGYMQHANSEKIPSYTKEDLLWRIRIALAGRAAETEFFGEKGINTGISSDIKYATKLAFDILFSYAMTDNKMACISQADLLSSPVGEEAIRRVNKLLEVEMAKTREIVSQGREKIKKLADYLRKNNQATEKEIISFFES